MRRLAITGVCLLVLAACASGGAPRGRDGDSGRAGIDAAGDDAALGMDDGGDVGDAGVPAEDGATTLGDGGSIGIDAATTIDAAVAVDAFVPRDAGPPDGGCVDSDGDGTCNATDRCTVGDDRMDTDGDGVPNACDCDPSRSMCHAMASCADATTGVVCTCLAGYTGDGRTCMPRDCGAIGPPANGTVSTPTTTFGATATYGCNAGYMLSGAATRTCQATGAWSGAAPTCAPVPGCPALSAPANGTVSVPSMMSGGTATYACNSGYQLLGSTVRRCTGTAWVGRAPTCVATASCVCAGGLVLGETVRATIASPNGAAGLAAGTMGTVLAGTTSTPPVLVQWSGWASGHNGNCSVATCGSCTNSGTSRWYVDCANVTPTPRLACGCGGTFRSGDRVVALAASPAGAAGLAAGTLGTVIAGSTGSLGILVQWDGWTSGHNGNCTSSMCGTCTASGTSRWYVNCTDVGLAP